MSDVEQVAETPEDPAPGGPQLGREVAPPKPRLRPPFVAALIVAIVGAAMAVVVMPTRSRATQATGLHTPYGPYPDRPTVTWVAYGWYMDHRAHCNSLEVDIVLRSKNPPMPDRIACLAIAGRIDHARTLLAGMPAGESRTIAHGIFEIAHPIADAGDDLAAGPIMMLVVEFYPENYMAVFHAGMAAFALGHDDIAGDYLNRFLVMYERNDVWRYRGEQALRDIANHVPVPERIAHFPE